MISTEKLMVISPLVSKETENTIGNLIPKIMSLVTKRSKFLMVLPQLFMLRDQRKLTPRQQQYRRLLRTIKPSELIFQAYQRILVKDKSTEEVNSYMEPNSSKRVITGMPPDAFMVNPLWLKSFLIRILAKLLNLTAVMSLEERKMHTDHLAFPQLEKTSPTKVSDQSLTTRITVMNQRPSTYFSHRTSKRWVLMRTIFKHQGLVKQ